VTCHPGPAGGVKGLLDAVGGDGEGLVALVVTDGRGVVGAVAGADRERHLRGFAHVDGAAVERAEGPVAVLGDLQHLLRAGDLLGAGLRGGVVAGLAGVDQVGDEDGGEDADDRDDDQQLDQVKPWVLLLFFMGVLPDDGRS